MMRKIVSMILQGMASGSLVMNITLVCFLLFADESLKESVISVDNYGANFIFSSIVGITFSLGSLAYEVEQWSFFRQIATHIGGGMVVMYLCAYFAGWIPTGLPGILTYLVGSLASTLVIWFGFYLYNRKETKLINAALQEKAAAAKGTRREAH